jgi:uncharacterized FlaG/YvyC family protein
VDGTYVGSVRVPSTGNVTADLRVLRDTAGNALSNPEAVNDTTFVGGTPGPPGVRTFESWNPTGTKNVSVRFTVNDSVDRVWVKVLDEAGNNVGYVSTGDATPDFNQTADGGYEGSLNVSSVGGYRAVVGGLVDASGDQLADPATVNDTTHVGPGTYGPPDVRTFTASSPSGTQNVTVRFRVNDSVGRAWIPIEDADGNRVAAIVRSSNRDDLRRVDGVYVGSVNLSTTGRFQADLGVLRDTDGNALSNPETVNDSTFVGGTAGPPGVTDFRSWNPAETRNVTVRFRVNDSVEKAWIKVLDADGNAVGYVTTGDQYADLRKVDGGYEGSVNVTRVGGYEAVVAGLVDESGDRLANPGRVNDTTFVGGTAGPPGVRNVTAWNPAGTRNVSVRIEVNDSVQRAWIKVLDENGNRVGYVTTADRYADLRAVDGGYEGSLNVSSMGGYRAVVGGLVDESGDRLASPETVEDTTHVGAGTYGPPEVTNFTAWNPSGTENVSVRFTVNDSVDRTWIVIENAEGNTIGSIARSSNRDDLRRVDGAYVGSVSVPATGNFTADLRGLRDTTGNALANPEAVNDSTFVGGTPGPPSVTNVTAWNPAGTRNVSVRIEVNDSVDRAWIKILDADGNAVGYVTTPDRHAHLRAVDGGYEGSLNVTSVGSYEAVVGGLVDESGNRLSNQQPVNATTYVGEGTAGPPDVTGFRAWSPANTRNVSVRFTVNDSVGQARIPIEDADGNIVGGIVRGQNRDDLRRVDGGYVGSVNVSSTGNFTADLRGLRDTAGNALANPEAVDDTTFVGGTPGPPGVRNVTAWNPAGTRNVSVRIEVNDSVRRAWIKVLDETGNAVGYVTTADRYADLQAVDGGYEGSVNVSSTGGYRAVIGGLVDESGDHLSEPSTVNDTTHVGPGTFGPPEITNFTVWNPRNTQNVSVRFTVNDSVVRAWIPIEDADGNRVAAIVRSSNRDDLRAVDGTYVGSVRVPSTGNVTADLQVLRDTDGNEFAKTDRVNDTTFVGGTPGPPAVTNVTAWNPSESRNVSVRFTVNDSVGWASLKVLDAEGKEIGYVTTGDRYADLRAVDGGYEGSLNVTSLGSYEVVVARLVDESGEELANPGRVNDTAFVGGTAGPPGVRNFTAWNPSGTANVSVRFTVNDSVDRAWIRVLDENGNRVGYVTTADRYADLRQIDGGYEGSLNVSSMGGYRAVVGGLVDESGDQLANPERVNDTTTVGVGTFGPPGITSFRAWNPPDTRNVSVRFTVNDSVGRAWIPIENAKGNTVAAIARGPDRDDLRRVDGAYLGSVNVSSTGNFTADLRGLRDTTGNALANPKAVNDSTFVGGTPGPPGVSNVTAWNPAGTRNVSVRIEVNDSVDRAWIEILDANGNAAGYVTTADRYADLRAVDGGYEGSVNVSTLGGYTAVVGGLVDESGDHLANPEAVTDRTNVGAGTFGPPGITSFTAWNPPDTRNVTVRFTVNDSVGGAWIPIVDREGNAVASIARGQNRDDLREVDGAYVGSVNVSSTGQYTADLRGLRDTAGNRLSTPAAYNQTVFVGQFEQRSLELSPRDDLEYGVMTAGASRNGTIVVYNDGTEAVTVTASTSEQTGRFEVVDPVDREIDLSPGQEAFLTVQATATTAGDLSGSLSLTGDVTRSVRLNGSARAPDLTIPTLEPVDVGNTAVGSSETVAVSLRNDGSAPLSVDLGSAFNRSETSFSLVGDTSSYDVGAGEHRNVTIAYSPATAGGDRATLSLETNDPVASSDAENVTLVGTGVEANVTASPTRLSAGSVGVGGNETVSVTLTNDGESAVTFDTPAITGTQGAEFSAASPSRETLDPGESARVNVTFEPSASGVRTATLSLPFSTETGADSSTVRIALSGTGEPPALSTDRTALQLGVASVDEGTERASVELRNRGPPATTLTVDSLSIPSEQFRATAGTPIQIAGGQNETVAVEFRPSALGEQTATLSVDASGPVEPYNRTIEVSGVGATARPNAPTEMRLGETPINATRTERFSVTNSGGVALSVDDDRLSVTGDAEVVQAELIGPTEVVPGAETDVAVSVRPDSSGPIDATVTVPTTDSDVPDPSVSITATAIAPDFEAGADSITFDSTPIGSSSRAAVTVTNGGSAPLELAAPTIEGEDTDSVSILGSTASRRIASGARETIAVGFAPTAETNHSAKLVLRPRNDPGVNTHSVSLSGEGVAGSAKLSNPAVSFDRVSLGTTATRTLRVENTGAGPLAIESVALEGANTSAFEHDLSGTTIAAGSAEPFSIAVTAERRGSLQSELVIETNATDSSTLRSTVGATGVAPAIELDTHTLDAADFGQTRLGNATETRLQIENTGNAPLNLTQLNITGSDSSAFTVVRRPTDDHIESKSSDTVGVAFDPAAASDAIDRATGTPLSASASLAIGSNVSDPDRQSMSVRLRGEGITPAVQTSQETLRFGTTTVGQRVARTLTVENAPRGTASVSLEDVSITGTDSDEFDVLSGPAEGTLAPGENVTIDVGLTPESVGDKLAAVHVQTNDSRDPMTIVGLSNTETIYRVTFGSVHVTYLNPVPGRQPTVDVNRGLRGRNASLRGVTGAANTTSDYTIHFQSQSTPYQSAGALEAETYPLEYLDITTTAGREFENLTYRVTVSKAALASVNASPDEVTIYHESSGGYEPLETDLRYETQRGYVLETTATDLSVFAIGAGTRPSGPTPPTPTPTPTPAPTPSQPTPRQGAGNVNDVVVHESQQSTPAQRSRTPSPPTPATPSPDGTASPASPTSMQDSPAVRSGRRADSTAETSDGEQPQPTETVASKPQGLAPTAIGGLVGGLVVLLGGFALLRYRRL